MFVNTLMTYTISYNELYLQVYKKYLLSKKFHLFESKNARAKQYGLYCIAYIASQVGKLFPLKYEKFQFR